MEPRPRNQNAVYPVRFHQGGMACTRLFLFVIVLFGSLAGMAKDGEVSELSPLFPRSEESGVGGEDLSNFRVSNGLGFGPAFESYLNVPGQPEAPAAMTQPGWFPDAERTISEIFDQFEAGRQHWLQRLGEVEEAHKERGLNAEEAQIAGHEDMRRLMDLGQLGVIIEGKGRVSFTNIHDSPVAEIDHQRSHTRFLFIDAGLVPKNSAHLRKYVARQNSEKKRHVVLIWLNDSLEPAREERAIDPVDVAVHRHERLTSVHGAMRRFQQYFYSFYQKPTKDNVAFGLVCGLINAGIIGVGVSAIKVAFDPSAEFLWTPVVLGGLWSTVLGIYSQSYWGWIYNSQNNRYMETIKTIANTALFNVVAIYASSIESGHLRGVTVEDPSAALFKDNIEAPPEQGHSNLQLLAKAALGTWIHGWSKVEVGNLFRLFKEAKFYEGSTRIFKVPFTNKEFYQSKHLAYYQIFGSSASQIPRIADIIGISMSGVPVGTIFFYTYGFLTKGAVQWIGRRYFPDTEAKLRLEARWRPIALPFYYLLGRGLWDLVRGKIGQPDSEYSGELLTDVGLMSRIRSRIYSPKAQERFDLRWAQLKEYYWQNPVRIIQTSSMRLQHVAKTMQHMWTEYRTGVTHEHLVERREEQERISQFLDDVSSMNKRKSPGMTCQVVFASQ